MGSLLMEEAVIISKDNKGIAIIIIMEFGASNRFVWRGEVECRYTLIESDLSIVF